MVRPSGLEPLAFCSFYGGLRRGERSHWMVQETAIADLRKNGFTLISVAEPDLMASDPTRVLMRQLMGAVPQYDKSQIVAKLRGARMQKAYQRGPVGLGTEWLWVQWSTQQPNRVNSKAHLSPRQVVGG
jgi:hypothetical protein